MENYEASLKKMINDLIDDYEEQGFLSPDKLKVMGKDATGFQFESATTVEGSDELKWIKQLMFSSIATLRAKDNLEHIKLRNELERYCVLIEDNDLFGTYECLEDGYKN